MIQKPIYNYVNVNYYLPRPCDQQVLKTVQVKMENWSPQNFAKIPFLHHTRAYNFILLPTIQFYNKYGL